MRGADVWITGVGLLTSVGENAAENWEAFRAGTSGVARHQSEESESLPDNFLYHGRIPGHKDPPEVPPRLASQRKFLNRGSILGLYAAAEAVACAGLDMSEVAPERKSLYVGAGDFTRVGYVDFYAALKQAAGEAWDFPNPESLNEAALHKVSPFFLLEGLPNNLFSYLSAMYEFMGPNGSFSSLSSCGAQALENCDRVLRFGEADVGLVVGCGSWAHPVMLLELDGLGILSQAKDGPASFRPFDKRRDGFFPGEGAAALVLESAESARARGAKPLGRVIGAANCQEFSSERYIPVPTGAVLHSVESAMAEAGLSPDELAFILPHGSATPQGDAGELSALLSYCDKAKCASPLAGWKPYTGHMGSASDLSEMILGLSALKDGRLPPTPGLEQKDDAFEALHIPAEECAVEGAAFLSLSHGIGGQSSATIVAAQ